MLTQTPGCTVTTALGSSESTLWLCRCLQELNNRLAAEISRLRTLLTGDAGGEAAGSPLTQGKDAYELEVWLRARPFTSLRHTSRTWDQGWPQLTGKPKSRQDTENSQPPDSMGPLEAPGTFTFNPSSLPCPSPWFPPHHKC